MGLGHRVSGEGRILRTLPELPLPRILILGLALAAGLAVSACRKEEQKRPLSFAKGHYAGKPVAEPSHQALDAARARVDKQNF